jgi:hypothetical protein
MEMQSLATLKTPLGPKKKKNSFCHTCWDWITHSSELEALTATSLRGFSWRDKEGDQGEVNRLRSQSFAGVRKGLLYPIGFLLPQGCVKLARTILPTWHLRKFNAAPTPGLRMPREASGCPGKPQAWKLEPLTQFQWSGRLTIHKDTAPVQGEVL